MKCAKCSRALSIANARLRGTLVCLAHDGGKGVEIVFAQWRTIHRDPRNKLVRRRQTFSSAGGSIDKSLAKISGGASMNVVPADAMVGAAIYSISYGIL